MAQPTNTQFALAVHVLTLLTAQPEDMRTSEQLAGSAGSNPVHVRRVLGQLRRAGLVSSRPGPRGGWVVREGACDVTLREIWEAVNGDDPVLAVHSAALDCVPGQRIQAELERIERRAAAALGAELERTTLGELARAAA
jgi:Rrf2 family protein